MSLAGSPSAYLEAELGSLRDQAVGFTVVSGWVRKCWSLTGTLTAISSNLGVSAELFGASLHVKLSISKMQTEVKISKGSGKKVGTPQ